MTFCKSTKLVALTNCSSKACIFVICVQRSLFMALFWFYLFNLIFVLLLFSISFFFHCITARSSIYHVTHNCGWHFIIICITTRIITGINVLPYVFLLCWTILRVKREWVFASGFQFICTFYGLVLAWMGHHCWLDGDRWCVYDGNIGLRRTFASLN